MPYSNGHLYVDGQDRPWVLACAKCQFAFPGTYGHECGLPATNILVSVMPDSVKTALQCLGVSIQTDGMSRAGRCEIHRNVREAADGAIVRTDEICRPHD